MESSTKSKSLLIDFSKLSHPNSSSIDNQNIHPHDLAKFLDTDKICIRAGHHCAQPIMNKLGISASARASFYLYNDTNDIDQLIQSIKKTANIFV